MRFQKHDKAKATAQQALFRFTNLTNTSQLAILRISRTNKQGNWTFAADMLRNVNTNRLFVTLDVLNYVFL